MLNFRLTKRHNVLHPDQPPTYHARLQSQELKDLRYISDILSERSSLTPMDVTAVVEGLLEIIPELLLQGHRIKLGDFGNFRLSVHSDGVENPEDFRRHLIHDVSMVFKPSKQIRRRLRNVQLRKLPDREV